MENNLLLPSHRKWRRGVCHPLHHRSTVGWKGNILHGDGDGSVLVTEQRESVRLRASIAGGRHGPIDFDCFCRNLLLVHDGNHAELFD